MVDYDPTWPETFEDLKASVAAALGDAVVAIEHVGSTSVPGLAAKPIIDMSIVVDSADNVPGAIEMLATLGYRHLGDLGIGGREAFENPAGLADHNLYVCPQGGEGLRNHLAMRDHLREHPEVAAEYGRLKERLAAEAPNDIDAYVDGKTEFILSVLAQRGLNEDELARIEAANRLPPT